MFRLCVNDPLYWGEMLDEARYLHSFVILPGYNGLGFGDDTLSMIENMVRAQGIKILRLDCVAENTKLVDYYKRHGFVPLFEKKMNPHVNLFFEKQL